LGLLTTVKPPALRERHDSLKILTIVFHNLHQRCKQSVSFQWFKGMGK
jgi:hypothetical protein